MWIYFLHIFHFISSLIKVIPLTSPSCNKNDLNSDVFLTRINFFSSYNFTHFPKRRGISLHLFCKVSSHLYLLQVTTILANRRVWPTRRPHWRACTCPLSALYFGRTHFTVLSLEDYPAQSRILGILGHGPFASRPAWPRSPNHVRHHEVLVPVTLY